MRKRRNACPHCGRPITQQVAEKTPIRTIAIDGPAAAGKTTTAKILAEKLGFTYLDTGAMYRAIAVKYRDTGERNIEEMLKKTTMRVERCGIYGQKIFVNDFNVTGMLREREISMLASTLSKERSVRQFLLTIQRRFAAEHSVVMEGRDIGTVVLPNADLKIFLTADLETRAERRLAEMRLARRLQRQPRSAPRRVAPAGRTGYKPRGSAAVQPRRTASSSITRSSVSQKR